MDDVEKSFEEYKNLVKFLEYLKILKGCFINLFTFNSYTKCYYFHTLFKFQKIKEIY